MIFIGRQILVYHIPKDEPGEITQQKAQLFASTVMYESAIFRGEITR